MAGKIHPITSLSLTIKKALCKDFKVLINIQ